MLSSIYTQELEQDPFDPDDFVERLAWRITNGETPDPVELHKAFEEEIQNLQMLSDQFESKINLLQNKCREEDEEFYEMMERLQIANEVAVGDLGKLDSKINAVSAQVVHLGDQLQSVNAPRARAFEALQLMKYFNEFMSDMPLESEIFHDPDYLLEAGDVIQKLFSIAQELSSDKFHEVEVRIGTKYAEIESALIDSFGRAHFVAQKNKMKQIAHILSSFKGYGQCVDTFVGKCQDGAFKSSDVFGDVQILCQKSKDLIYEVFLNPEQVMAKLVLNIFHGKLQEVILTKLADTDDAETYLANFHELYSKTQKLVAFLKQYEIANEEDFLSSLTRHLFGKHLETYMQRELNYLETKTSDILQRYYARLGHQKKTIQSGGVQDFKRDLQARFIPESFGGQTFLSEEVAINILQETKQAFQRCHLLSPPGAVAENADKIVDVLLRALCVEHIDYAVELALYGIPLSEPKTKPETFYLEVTRQANAICHLLDRQFDDSVVPLIRDSARYEDCVSKKQVTFHTLETKMSNGLDRLLNAMAGYMRYILSTKQSRADFRPDDDNFTLEPDKKVMSKACDEVTEYFKEQVQTLKDTIDGQNIELCLAELGSRFHRVILDHIYNFVYNTTGAMNLLLDIGVYRKTADELKIPLVYQLFETLHGLCNLLVVVPENLVDASKSDLLEDVDKTVVLNFVQLRADYKNIRIANLF